MEVSGKMRLISLLGSEEDVGGLKGTGEGLGDRDSSLEYGQPVCLVSRQAWAPACYASPEVKSQGFK